jgi:hypothetical protein
MSRRIIPGLLAVALLTVPLTVTSGRAAESDAGHTDAYVSDFADFLGFVGGFPLSPAQRQLIATQTAADLHANPGSVQSTDDTVRKLLAKVNVGDASAVAERRETFRLQTATLPASNVGHVVVESNDPTVVFDRQHQRLITERSLTYLQRACTWMAKVLGVPGPDAGFVAKHRALFRDHYDRLTDSQQETLAHIERDLPLLVAAFDKAGSAKQAQFVRAVRPYSREREQLAPLTVALLGATQSAVHSRELVNHQIINNSIVLMGQMNTTMLYRTMYRMR